MREDSKLKPVMLYVTEDEKAIIEALAEKTNRSQSNLGKVLFLEKAEELEMVERGKLKPEFEYLLKK